MYEDFRLSFLRELAETGLDDESMRRVMGAIDKVGAEFDVNRKETALVPIGMTGHRLLMEFLACKSLEGLSKQTLRCYHWMLSCFISAINKPIEEIEPTDVRLYLYQYQQKRKISNRTLEGIRGKLASFFKWAVSEGRIARNPCAPIHPIKYIAKPRNAMSQLDLEYMRRACGGARERAIVEMFYSTGCRVSELCGMKKSDVDWRNQTVQVFGKGNKYRTCFINAKAYVTLKDYLSTRDDDNEHLFVSERRPHQGLTRFAIEKIVRDISDRAYRLTGKRVTPHIFRHTTATVALQAGMPVQNVSQMLGHERIETTMIYSEVDAGDVKRDHIRYVV